MTQMQLAERPVFVLGPPRSGTSMMQWALKQHPNLWGGPESDFMVPLVRGARSAFEFGSRRDRFHWLSGQGVTWEEFANHIGIGLNALYSDRSKGLRWVEQTPYYTLSMDDIADLFPDAQFLLMVRDGREVVHSLRNFVNPMEHVTAAKTWVQYLSAALEFEASDRGSMVTRVRYGEMVTSTSEAMAAALDAIEEPFHEGCVEFIRDGKPINSSFGDEGKARGPRWAVWTPDERREFIEIAGDLLVQLDFVADHSWAEL